MTISTPYPGVYVNEIPSGVRTITGVATSVTAFLGRTRRGPVNTAVYVNGYADYQRIFGGLWRDSTVSYAVRDFFANGGGQAVVVRLARDAATAAFPALAVSEADRKRVADAKTKADAEAKSATTQAGKAEDVAKKAEQTAASADTPAADRKKAQADAKAARAVADEAAADAAEKTAAADAAAKRVDDQAAGLVLAAAEPGSWANNLIVTLTHPESIEQDVLGRLGVGKDDVFDLTVTDKVTGAQETFTHVHVGAGARRVDSVLASESRTVRAVQVPVSRPLEAAGVAVSTSGTDGAPPRDGDYTNEGLMDGHKGLWALDLVDQFNLLCIPPAVPGGDTSPSVYGTALAYCKDRRAMLIVDPPAAMTVATAAASLQKLGLTGEVARNGVIYFPRVIQGDPAVEGRVGTFPACGVLAGVMARTDATRGVWKAPAGLDATLAGVDDLAVNLTDVENGTLNAQGVNCLRTMPAAGRIVWGARTLRGADRLADEYKYVPVRRLALYIEESLFRGTQWVVYEPNDEPLWAQIRLNVGAFLQNLFRQGAFQGATPRDAYFVKCDRETTTPYDVNSGRVNVLVGFAPLRPAEFVVLSIQQIAQA
ncbi:phage tail sheath subtilisin-like domain-containing protein [Streptosporangiaceae bacterium NEAU-GS5]|nr:phage tail sheath subtilisin-like domain-containing protein [Streptosporangiaceae bacterium NEAU-GS5]